MPDCRTIDALVTPYVDGAITAADRAQVDQHIGRCPRCRSRVMAEQAVHHLLRERHTALTSACAPPSLKAACERSARLASGTAVVPAQPTRSWSARFAPFGAAAAVLILVGGAFLYQATGRSERVMAAELAADHLKCLTMNAVLGTHHSPQVVEAEMADQFGWTMHLPANLDAQDLELVGSRPCLYGQGKIAHIMYRHHGQLVSLFMLPRTERPAQTLDALGHQCAIWSKDDRTFVLVAREARADVEHLAAVMHAALE